MRLKFIQNVAVKLTVSHHILHNYSVLQRKWMKYISSIQKLKKRISIITKFITSSAKAFQFVVTFRFSSSDASQNDARQTLAGDQWHGLDNQ